MPFAMWYCAPLSRRYAIGILEQGSDQVLKAPTVNAALLPIPACRHSEFEIVEYRPRGGKRAKLGGQPGGQPR
jgi:hypothetical protein